MIEPLRNVPCQNRTLPKTPPWGPALRWSVHHGDHGGGPFPREQGAVEHRMDRADHADGVVVQPAARSFGGAAGAG